MTVSCSIAVTIHVSTVVGTRYTITLVPLSSIIELVNYFECDMKTPTNRVSCFIVSIIILAETWGGTCPQLLPALSPYMLCHVHTCLPLLIAVNFYELFKKYCTTRIFYYQNNLCFKSTYSKCCNDWFV